VLKNLSEKYKLYLIVAGIILASIIAYRVAIKSTVMVMKDYRELKQKAAEAEDISSRCAALQKQLTILNRSYFDAAKGIDDTHNIFLDKLGRLAATYNATVTEYPAQHSYRASSVQVETHIAVLQGNFSDLLKVLYELEVNERIGRLVSVEYFTETNRKTKIRSLYMRIYIQNYRNKENNENS
jgi:hypothetical protein